MRWAKREPQRHQRQPAALVAGPLGPAGPGSSHGSAFTYYASDTEVCFAIKLYSALVWCLSSSLCCGSVPILLACSMASCGRWVAWSAWTDYLRRLGPVLARPWAGGLCNGRECELGWAVGVARFRHAVASRDQHGQPAAAAADEGLYRFVQHTRLLFGRSHVRGRIALLLADTQPRR